ncbi:uncharacterized protein LOC122538303 [Frieseomelitta varia]|uniref:uncharacterized protein LOC122538303 n=1 Tax=Frieseomelitta varia TaxID=561572 RepID=UPI001CB67F56|nr:uncharacterized protein LOC122538303 [Frieseomelitta varia]
MSKREGLKRKIKDDSSGSSDVSRTVDPVPKKEKVDIETESSETTSDVSQLTNVALIHTPSYSSESSLQSSSRDLPPVDFDSDSDEIESENGAEEEIILPFKFLHITFEESDEELEEPPLASQVVHEFTNENPGQAQFPFKGTAGVFALEYPKTPIKFFRLIANDAFLTCIISRINFLGNKLKTSAIKEEKTSRFHNWQPITQKEFERFLAIIYLMGQIKATELSWYWRKSRIYQCPIFVTVMPKSRFLEILHVFHIDCKLEEDQDIDEPSDQMNPLDIFNNNMKEIYYPTKGLTIDESVISFRSQLYFRQNAASKKCKYGLKIYTLTEPIGPVLRIHTHLHTKGKDKINTDQIIHKLVSDFEGRGHVIYLDETFANYTLVKSLLEKKTYALGVLKKSGLDKPADVVNAVLNTGQVFQQFSPEGICLMKYKHTEKDSVIMISSERPATMASVIMKGKMIEKPRIFLDYNTVMDSAERTDEFFMFYPCDLIKGLLLTTKFAIHMFQIILYNSYLLCCRYYKVKFSKFRDSTIKALLRSTVSLDLETSLKRELQRNRIHVPVIVEEDEKKFCIVCQNEGQQRKETKLKCSNCSGKPGLCVDQCFRRYHNYY